MKFYLQCFFLNIDKRLTKRKRNYEKEEKKINNALTLINRSLRQIEAETSHQTNKRNCFSCKYLQKFRPLNYFFVALFEINIFYCRKMKLSFVTFEENDSCFSFIWLKYKYKCTFHCTFEH
jgi:hypothetical protein